MMAEQGCDDWKSRSRMTPLSRSAEDVRQLDACFVQINIRDFKQLIANEAREEMQGKKSRLRSSRGAAVDFPQVLETQDFVPLCNALNAVEQRSRSQHRWKIVAHRTESAEIYYTPDLARYPLNVPAAIQAYTRDSRGTSDHYGRCAWAWMSSVAEVARSNEETAFHTDATMFLTDSTEGKKTRMRLVSHATEALIRQQRTRFWMCYFARSCVWVLRWDRTACIVSHPIDLSKNAKEFCDILCCLSTAAEDYGRDQTAKLATEEDIALVQAYDIGHSKYLQEYKDMMLNDRVLYPIYKVTCPAVVTEGETADLEERAFLIGRYTFCDSHDSPFGRCTRNYAAFDLRTRRFAWLKDQWRCASRGHTELDAYTRLHSHSVPYIATPIAGGDIDGHRTACQRYTMSPAAAKCSSERIHTRLVTKELGRLLETYEDSAELLVVCASAFAAHKKAYEDAAILHGNVTTHNIMIDVEAEKGFLNDWDLCIYREELADTVPVSDPTDALGPWPFRSALSIQYPRRPYSVADDIESFVYVPLFLACRFHRHEFSPDPNGTSEHAFIEANIANPAILWFVSAFFYTTQRTGGARCRAGAEKREAIRRGAPPITLEPTACERTPPLGRFLELAYATLAEHYWALDPAELAQWEDAPEVPMRSPSPEPVATPKMIAEAKAQVDAFLDACRAEFGEHEPRRRDDPKPDAEAARRKWCPFKDPQRVLDSHASMGRVFLALLHDKSRVEEGRGDKHYDQFLNWGMLCKLERLESDEVQLAEAAPVSAGKKRKRVQDDSDPKKSLPRSKKQARASQKVAAQAAAKSDRGRRVGKDFEGTATRRSTRLAAKEKHG